MNFRYQSIDHFRLGNSADDLTAAKKNPFSNAARHTDIGFPRFSGDKALVEGFMRNGYSAELARRRIAVGCNWMCVPGKEYPMNDTVKVNIAKVFDVAMEEMKGMPQPSTTLLFSLFSAHLKKAVEVTAAGVNLHLDHQWEVTPELVMNLMMENTLETGTFMLSAF